MKDQKFHLTENGPAPCRIRSRRCKYETEGTEAEIGAIWQKQLDEEFGEQLLAGATKGGFDPGFENTRRLIDDEFNYFPDPKSDVSYDPLERSVAMKVAAASLDKSSYIDILGKDENGPSLVGESDVQKLSLSDGSSGYFKSLRLNSLREVTFSKRGTNSLAGFISEVNSFRMSQLMGGGFSKLVPKTEIRSFGGELGSLQFGVEESKEFYPSYEQHKGLVEDYRKAAILDFVIGSLDRHPDNFLYEEQPNEFEGAKDRPAIRLIDNALAFPDGTATINQSVFSQNKPTGQHWDLSDDIYKGIPKNEMNLKPDEIESLNKARAGLAKWIDEGTILKNNGERAIKRIDYLLKGKSLRHTPMMLSVRNI